MEKTTRRGATIAHIGIAVRDFDAILLGAFGDPRIKSNIHAKEILRMRSVINKLLADHSGQSIEKIEQDVERDFIMSAQQAKEYGLIDEIIHKHR